VTPLGFHFFFPFACRHPFLLLSCWSFFHFRMLVAVCSLPPFSSSTGIPSGLEVLWCPFGHFVQSRTFSPFFPGSVSAIFRGDTRLICSLCPPSTLYVSIPHFGLFPHFCFPGSSPPFENRCELLSCLLNPVPLLPTPDISVFFLAVLLHPPV